MIEGIKKIREAFRKITAGLRKDGTINARPGLDVNVEYVRNGMNDEMLAIEVFETQEIAREKDDDKNKDIDVDRISRLMREKL